MENNQEIIVTSPDIYAKRLCDALESEGLSATSVPLIETDTMSHINNIKALIDNIQRYSLIVFTSRSAIKAFASAMPEGYKLSIPCCAFGKDNDFIVQTLHVNPDFISDEPSPTGVANYLAEHGKYRNNKNICVLAPMTDGAKEPDTIPDFINLLEETGWNTKLIRAYTTRIINGEKIKNILKDSKATRIIAFTSGVEVEAFLSNINITSCNQHNYIYCCFGPYTAAYAKKLGMEIDFVPSAFDSFQSFAKELRLNLNK